MKPYRLVVRTPTGTVDMGTGWLVEARTVCTAFHVVGHAGARQWLHELGKKDVTYWLESGEESHQIFPAAFDSEADLALLSSDTDLGEAYRLADITRRNVAWEADGFPGFGGTNTTTPVLPFKLGGTVDTVHGGALHSRSVQLHIRQGANVPWNGISGAAVLDEARVGAVITNVTSGVATAWAAPVEAVRRLVAIRALSARVARMLGPAADRLQAPDSARVSAALDAVGDHAEVAAFRAELAQLRASPEEAGPPPETLDALHDAYGVAPRSATSKRLHRLATLDFTEVFHASQRFGGRARELARLAAFVSDKPSGHCFVTGGSGYGKTSLLAHWIQLLCRQGESVCFHFFTPRIEESIEPAAAFRSLAEQLLAAYDLVADIPQDRAGAQRLCTQLLEVPSPRGRPLIVVLDALDEVMHRLPPGPSLVPHRLGTGVYLVFSARQIGIDWLQELDLPLAKEDCIVLGQLDADDVAGVLTRAGVEPSAELVERLMVKTSGDPFYVADVIRVMQEEGGDITALAALPSGHSEYLRLWWDDAVQRVNEPGFVDLMGTLTALKAPLGARELAAISNQDKLEPGRVSVLATRAARYIEGPKGGPFWLRHDRIRQFVSEELGPEMDTYRQRATGFALRWNDPALTLDARAYGRRHAAQHLLDAGRFEDAVAMVDAIYMAEIWTCDGSYAPLLNVLDAIFDWAIAHLEHRSAVCQASSLIIARETARDLMRQLPEGACRAWVHLAGHKQLRALLDTLPTHRGEAREPLLAVASELMRSPADAGTREWVLELLSRVMAMLPYVRTKDWTREAWQSICELLANPQFGQEAVPALRQARAYVEQLGPAKADLKAASLAHLAVAVLRSDPALAKQCLAEFDGLIPNLAPGDRAFVCALAAPAYRELDPDRLESVMTAAIESVSAKDQSSFSSAPLDELVRAWAPRADVLRASRTADGTPLNGQVSAMTLLALTDRPEEPWSVIERNTEGDPARLVAAFATWFRELPNRRQEIVERVSGLAAEHLDAPALAPVWAWAGRWSEMRACVQQTTPELSSVLVEALEFVLGRESDASRDAMIQFLVSRLEAVEDEEARADCAGKMAYLLARAGDARGPGLFGLSLSTRLSQLPEGDADGLRLIASRAIAGDNPGLDSAIAIALRCQWFNNRIAALCGLLTITTTRRGDVTDVLVAALAPPLDRTFGRDALSTVCATARVLMERDASTAVRLLDAVAAAVPHLSRPQEQLPILASLLQLEQAWAVAGSGTRFSHLVNLSPWLVTIDAADAGVGPLFEVASLVVRSHAAEPSLLEELLQRARTTAKNPVEVLAAAAAGWAPIDAGRATTLLNEAVSELPATVGSEKAALVSHFRRILQELTGQTFNPSTDGIGAVLTACGVARGHGVPEAATDDLIDRTWQFARSLPKSAPLRRSAIRAFLKGTALLPDAVDTLVTKHLRQATTQLRTDGDAIDVDKMLDGLSSEVAQLERFARALFVASQIADDTARDSAMDSIRVLERARALPARSPVEDALLEVATGTTNLFAALVLNELRDSPVEAVLQEMLSLLKSDPIVRRKLLEIAAPVIPAVVARWGAEAGTQVLENIEDFDKRLQQAAKHIGTLQAR